MRNHSMKKAIVLLLCAALSGCGAVYSYVNNEDKLDDRLRVPMTKKEVLAELGKADNVLRDDGRTIVWEYKLYSRHAWVAEIVSCPFAVFSGGCIFYPWGSVVFSEYPKKQYAMLIDDNLCRWGNWSVISTRKTCMEPSVAKVAPSQPSSGQEAEKQSTQEIKEEYLEDYITVTPVFLPPPIVVPVSRLAVIPLAESASGNVAVLLDTALNILRTRHPQLVLVERDLQPVLDELHLQYSGRVDDETAVRVGRLTGVDTILVYRIDPMPAVTSETASASTVPDASFEIRLIQVESGHVLFRQTAIAVVDLPRPETPATSYAKQHDEAKRKARAELRARGLDEGYLFEMVKVATEWSKADPQWVQRVPIAEQIPRVADEVARRIRAGTARRGTITGWPDQGEALTRQVQRMALEDAASYVLAALGAAFGDNPLGMVPRLLGGMDPNTTETNPHVVVYGVLQGGLAHMAGLRKGDHILAVNGQPFPTWTTPISLPAILTIEREGKRQEMSVTASGR